MACERRFKSKLVSDKPQTISFRNGSSNRVTNHHSGLRITRNSGDPNAQESLNCPFQDGTRDFSIKSSPILSKMRKQSANLEMKPQGASRNHYTQGCFSSYYKNFNSNFKLKLSFSLREQLFWYEKNNWKHLTPKHILKKKRKLERNETWIELNLQFSKVFSNLTTTKRGF